MTDFITVSSTAHGKANTTTIVPTPVYNIGSHATRQLQPELYRCKI